MYPLYVPGAPKKGTKNKVGMLEAFEDPNTKGFNWNNFMLQRWVDLPEDVEHSVLEDYLCNMALIGSPLHSQMKLRLNLIVLL